MKYGLPGNLALGVVGGTMVINISARRNRQIAEYFRDQQQ